MTNELFFIEFIEWSAQMQQKKKSQRRFNIVAQNIKIMLKFVHKFIIQNCKSAEQRVTSTKNNHLILNDCNFSLACSFHVSTTSLYALHNISYAVTGARAKGNRVWHTNCNWQMRNFDKSLFYFI